MKSWFLKLGLVGFLFFFVKGLLWIAVLWFVVSIFSVRIAQNERIEEKKPHWFFSEASRLLKGEVTSSRQPRLWANQVNGLVSQVFSYMI